MEEDIDISKRVEKDVEYIKNEVIAQQPNGAYTKWSRSLNAVTVVDITYKQYIEFWEKQYKNYPEYIDVIVDACIDKLDNGLIPRQQMIDMIRNSKDYESEKIKGIEALGGEYNGWRK